ncbi:MAG TPA: exopolysaccharide biosynthesis polyprenyl glycosylphosphotransferase [Baekduia sp.]|nr:exopolysaccharide biosynthesis polyprenyl glycosylphosphotransferase [Baekduia sp.]
MPPLETQEGSFAGGRLARLSFRPGAVIAEARLKDAVVQRDRRYRRNLMVADLLAALGALVACRIGSDGGTLSAVTLLGLPLILVASKLSGLYDRDHLLVRKMTINEIPALFQLATVYALVVWMLDGAVGDGAIGPARAGALWGSVWVLEVLLRRTARVRAARGVATERLLVVGDAATHQRIIEKLAAGRTNAQVVGRLSMHRVSRHSQEERPVDEATLRALTRDLDVHRVLVVPSQTNPQITADLVRAVKAVGVRVSIVPNVLDVVGSAVVFDDLAGLTVMGVREFALSRSSRMIKRCFDLVGSAIGLVLLSPVFAVIALVIKLDSRGPVYFRQERIGQGGHDFRMTKFRTMVPDAEDRKAELMEANEARGLFKIADDPRITRVGRVLRKTSLDELPQLLNVLAGEMSLVGPRPLIHSEDQNIKGYDRRRLDLMPGMTGHWQIMGSALVPMHEMVKIDYLYVTTWSLFEDMKILMRTIPYMMSRRGM